MKNNMKGETGISLYLGLAVGIIVVAIFLPIIYDAFVAPTSQQYTLTQNLNASLINGTTVTLDDNGGEFVYLQSVVVKNASLTIPATDYPLNKVDGKYDGTVSFKFAGAGKILPSNLSFYDVTGSWGKAGYQTSSLNQTLAPFAMIGLLIAAILIIASVL